MILVFDAVTLIYLGKARTLEKLEKLDAQLIIPAKVYREVVDVGIKRGFEEAVYIKMLVDSKLFSVEEGDIGQLKVVEQADLEVLELAKKLKGTAVTDDQKLRNLTSIEKVDNAGSVFLLLLLFKKKIITKAEVKSIIDKMIGSGWYCSTDFYTAIINKLAH
ncbi:MAG: DUF3368 domain-containing protein [Candidatus Aenigmarchaeota archaeon]|nr:DUF3368 domain-containing protein [Candidatus Aenigmarchaeota archaeon]